MPDGNPEVAANDSRCRKRREATIIYCGLNAELAGHIDIHIICAANSYLLLKGNDIRIYAKAIIKCK